MLKSYVYFPQDLDQQITMIARTNKISKAEAIRRAARDWVDSTINKDKGSAKSLLMLAELGKKFNLKGPKDLSTNLDKYLWDNYEV